MENIYVHLLPTFESLFKISRSQVNLISVASTESLSDAIDLEISNPQFFEIAVYPVGKNQKKLFSYSANFKYIEGQLTSENEYVRIYKLPENHFFIKFSPFFVLKEEIYGDKIEFNGAEIKKLTFMNDLAGRAKVEVFNADENRIFSQNEYFVYTTENIEKEKKPELVLLAFFEAYKVNDFNVCFSYLSESYGENLNKEGLRDFFGNFEECILVNYYAQPAVVLLYKDYVGVFSANIQERKITDIYELT